MHRLTNAVSKVRRFTFSGISSSDPYPAPPTERERSNSLPPTSAYATRKVIPFGQAVQGSSSASTWKQSDLSGSLGARTEDGSKASADQRSSGWSPPPEDAEQHKSTAGPSHGHSESSNGRSISVQKYHDVVDHYLSMELQQRYTALETLGYEVGAQIGKGSYAMVRKAVHLKSGRPVAVKIISKAKCPSDFLNKFLPRELAALRVLRHPNLITVYNITESQSRFYVIMDLATHGDLLEKIREHKRLSEQRAGRYFAGLIAGMTYVHSEGFVHRDLKCENLLLDQKDQVRITDFGFCRGVKHFADRAELCTTFCGSFAYAAPEILKAKPYDPFKSDTWSIGVILFTMVTGKLPFDDKDHKLLLELVHKPVRFPESVKTTKEYRDMVRRFLIPNPESRINLADVPDVEWYQMIVLSPSGSQQTKPASATSGETSSGTDRTSSERDSSSSNSANRTCRRIPLFPVAVRGVSDKPQLRETFAATNSDVPRVVVRPDRTSYQRQDVASYPRQDVTSYRRAGITSYRRADGTIYRRPDATSCRKANETSYRRSDVTSYRRPVVIPYRRQPAVRPVSAPRAREGNFIMKRVGNRTVIWESSPGRQRSYLSLPEHGKDDRAGGGVPGTHKDSQPGAPLGTRGSVVRCLLPGSPANTNQN